MKKAVLITLVLSFIGLSTQARQILSDDISLNIASDEITDKTIFHLKNIDGYVTAEGYEGNEILITGGKEVWREEGKATRDDLDKVKLVSKMVNNHLYVYIEAPGVEVNWDEGKLHYHVHSHNNSDDWGRQKSDDNTLRFSMNLQVQVPRYLMSEFSTINNGNVEVSDLIGGVKARNINGSISLRDIAGETSVNTVNGNIDVWFAESPKTDTKFHTVNGTIKIYSPKDLSAVVTFESLHGALYTDFENIEYLPNRMNKESGKGNLRYRIERTAPVKIGDGDVEMSFKMVNGSAYIRQRKS